MYIHGYLGLVVTLVTLFFGFYGWYKVGWTFPKKATKIQHYFFVYIVTWGILILSVLGYVSRQYMNRSKWSTRTALRIKFVHKYFAYLVIWAGFGSIATGIFGYRTFPCNPWNPYPDFPLEYVYLILTGVFYLGIEVLWRTKLIKEK